jgi:Arc/MetJ family transcription regulator
MRTTLNLDDEVMASLLQITKAPTKTEAVIQAIQEYVRRQQIEELRRLRGTVRLRNDWRRSEHVEVRDMKRLERRRG